MIERYAGQPEIVEAVCVTYQNAEDVAKWCSGVTSVDNDDEVMVSLYTSKGTVAARSGSWVVRDTDGQFSVCRDGIFKEMYRRDSHSGSKYHRAIRSVRSDEAEKSITIDVYSVMDAFGVTSQPRGHAIKKLLCAGLRGKGSERQDVSEAIDALKRDLEMLGEKDAATS